MIKVSSYFKSRKKFSFSSTTLGIILFLLIIGTIGGYLSLLKFSNLTSIEKDKETAHTQQIEDSEDVLGYRSPQIYISGSGDGYASGGMIALSSTDEPAVMIGGYNISGEIEIAMYEANEGAILDYLTHDAEGKQTKKTVDINQFRYVTSVKQPLNTGNDREAKVTLPFAETGIWYLTVKIGSINANAFVIRSNIGVLTKEGDNEFIFWGQNFKTKRSITEGSIKILNLQDNVKEIQLSVFSTEGIAKTTLNAQADIALVSMNEDRAIVPLNLKYLNTGYSYSSYQAKSRLTRYFIFTDRPLYRPGDKVFFKAVLRDDDDVRYFIPTGTATVRIYDGYYYSGSSDKPVYETSMAISPDGTVSGEYQLPESTKIGGYTLAVSVPDQAERSHFYSEWSANTITFDVQYFRKPEAEIDIIATKTHLVAQDKTSFKISGAYFSGQPLLNQKVKYAVFAADFYEYDYLMDQQNLFGDLNDDYRYGYWYGNKNVIQGEVTLNEKGEAEIDLATAMNFNNGKTKVFTIEATLADGSQNPTFARKNILVFAGEYGIYRKDYTYGAKVNFPLTLPLTLLPYRTNTSVANMNLTAKVHRENWIAFQEADKKYPSYRKETEDLPSLTAVSDAQGNAIFTFTPTKIGSYTVTVEGKDNRGNLISKKFYNYVRSENEPYYFGDDPVELTIIADKQKYQPTDTAVFNIFSTIPDRDILLTLERGRVNRFQVVHMNGKNGTVQIPLTNTDVPNIYTKVSSFSTYSVDENVVNLPVATDGKKLLVSITPNSKTYGPGETATVNVSTTDVGGNPVPAELALWTVDKAIFELSDNKLGDIFDTYWHERSNTTQRSHSLEGITVLQAEMGGGCFAAGTSVLMANGKFKNIEDIKTGDYILTRTEKDSKLVKAKITKTHSTEENGYLIINGQLKVTANHILWANNNWQEAGSLQIGDELTSNQGGQIKVNSIEWQAGKFNVYNLEVEKYHTYFAGGVWVHNQKGVQRNVFKDTAYWNPSLHTNGSGRAQISFKLPDNLTTWTLAAVGATADTKVGQTTNEIVVTKDLIVRPFVPNILRVGDEIYLSALVQNFTTANANFDIDLTFDAGEIESATHSGVLIPTNSMEQLYWKVRPEIEKDKAKLIFGARSRSNTKLADVVTQEIPVRAFGFTEKRAETGEGAKTYAVKIAADSHPEKSSVTLSLSPTLIGTLPSAMKYLINYPYGCVEQTTSRFVPAVIAKVNESMFTESLIDKDINDIIAKGLSRLSYLQQWDGGWAWWFSGNSDPFITAYVVEYLLQAQQAGIEIDNELFARAQNFLEKETLYNSKNTQQINYINNATIAKNYALTLLGAKDKVKKITDLSYLTPDLLSLAVMTNYLNGDQNPKTNGLDLLMSLAQAQGDAVFWNAGNKEHFGSTDASTALAIRAIILTQGNRDTAAKAVRYLTRTRQRDYWSNTFATAQVVRALVEFAKTGSELTPKFTYTVNLDGKQITQGAVSDSRQFIKDIMIPSSDISANGSTVSLTKTGDGQLYSTLLIDEFHTDKNARSIDHGLSVRREYVNEKGEQYSLAVGDAVTVKITVGGLKANENYGVIADELPAGLVPINPEFKNEQYGENSSRNYYSSYDVTDREITENGMVMSLYQLAAGERTYTYRARVVSEGNFLVPPATAALMYAPEINGRSAAQTLVIDKTSRLLPIKSAQKLMVESTDNKYVLITTIFGVIVLSLTVIILKRRGVTLRQIKDWLRRAVRRHKQPPPAAPMQRNSSPEVSNPPNSTVKK